MLYTLYTLGTQFIQIVTGTGLERVDYSYTHGVGLLIFYFLNFMFSCLLLSKKKKKNRTHGIKGTL